MQERILPVSSNDKKKQDNWERSPPPQKKKMATALPDIGEHHYDFDSFAPEWRIPEEYFRRCSFGEKYAPRVKGVRIGALNHPAFSGTHKKRNRKATPMSSKTLPGVVGPIEGVVSPAELVVGTSGLSVVGAGVVGGCVVGGAPG